MAARLGQRQVARDERIFAVPRLAEGAEAQQEALRQEVQLRIVDKINEMVGLARRQRPDLPMIDRESFSMSVPHDEMAVIQSAGFIFTANMRDGTISVYGKDSKVMMG